MEIQFKIICPQILKIISYCLNLEVDELRLRGTDFISTFFELLKVQGHL